MEAIEEWVKDQKGMINEVEKIWKGYNMQRKESGERSRGSGERSKGNGDERKENGGKEWKIRKMRGFKLMERIRK